MKKVLYLIVALLILVPVSAHAKDKVKVYVFEKDGCGWCAKQIDYLEGLSGYNKTFEVIHKQLYDANWNPADDYDLGVTVADAFKEVGFENAAYDGTPFVVISDLYAAAAYSDELETIIDDAANQGDKDIVGCFEKGNTNCLDYLKTNEKSDTSSSGSASNIGPIVITLISAVLIILVYIIKSQLDKKEILEAIASKNK